MRLKARGHRIPRNERAFDSFLTKVIEIRDRQASPEDFKYEDTPEDIPEEGERDFRQTV